MGSKFTKYDLQNITDYIEFESFCHNLMSREGYPNLEPLGGSQDKGRDAVHVSQSDGCNTIFAYSVREDWEDKLKEDLEKVTNHNHRCDKFVFVTNSKVTASEKDKKKQHVKDKYGFTLDIFDLERLTTLIEARHQDIIKLHPGIFTVSMIVFDRQTLGEELDTQLYIDYVLKQYDDWIIKYTALFANRRKLETFVVPIQSSNDNQGFPVTRIPSESAVSVILGESGAGKTIALWKIVTDTCHHVKKNNSGHLPILISMRHWEENHKCRDMIQDQFTLVGANTNSVEHELQRGNCLILIDGLNEIMPNETLKNKAYNDIQRLIQMYSKNIFIICCRTTDYSPHILESNYPRNPTTEPTIYEIRRLDREQITEYVQRYFHTKPEMAQKLLLKLDIQNETLWRDSRSILHLARIPLYLQLIITEFGDTEELPHDKGKLIYTLVKLAIKREDGKNHRIDQIGKEKILSVFAYSITTNGYALRIPEATAINAMGKAVDALRDSIYFPSDMTIGAIWREILSSNFIKVINPLWIEWLHQLILDYFLACEIARIETGQNLTEVLELNKWIKKRKWEQPCSIALGMLDYSHGSILLDQIIRVDPKMARRVLVNQSDEDITELTPPIIKELIEGEGRQLSKLPHVIPELPFLSIVESLFAYFRRYDDSTRVYIAEAISNLVISNYNSYINLGLDKIGVKEEVRTYGLAVKRGLQVLEAMSGNKNDMIRFFAAKGLWEYNKGYAAHILRELYFSKNPSVRNAVTSLRGRLEIQHRRDTMIGLCIGMRQSGCYDGIFDRLNRRAVGLD